MKKFTTVILAMLLVLVVGQATFANGNIGLTVGYGGLKTGTSVNSNGMTFGVSGGYYFTDKFGISADVSAGMLSDGAETDPVKMNLFNVAVFAKYDVFALDMATIGIQAGIMDSIVKGEDNLLGVGLGVYVDANVAPKFNLYADAKFPVFTSYKTDASETDIAEKVGFFKNFFYDVTVGATYDVTENIFVGIEGGIGNFNYLGFEGGLGNNFSIGAKVGYSF